MTYDVLLCRMVGDACDAIGAFLVLGRYAQTISWFALVASSVKDVQRANTITG